MRSYISYLCDKPCADPTPQLTKPQELNTNRQEWIASSAEVVTESHEWIINDPILTSDELRVGKSFTSFSEVEEWLAKLKQHFKPMKMMIAHSKKIPMTANNSHTNRTLLYSSIHYVCSRSGKYLSKGVGKRKRRSQKIGCPFSVRLHSSYNGRFLEIEECNLKHNHPRYPPEKHKTIANNTVKVSIIGNPKILYAKPNQVNIGASSPPHRGVRSNELPPPVEDEHYIITEIKQEADYNDSADIRQGVLVIPQQAVSNDRSKESCAAINEESPGLTRIKREKSPLIEEAFGSDVMDGTERAINQNVVALQGEYYVITEIKQEESSVVAEATCDIDADVQESKYSKQREEIELASDSRVKGSDNAKGSGSVIETVPVIKTDPTAGPAIRPSSVIETDTAVTAGSVLETVPVMKTDPETKYVIEEHPAIGPHPVMKHPDPSNSKRPSDIQLPSPTQIKKPKEVIAFIEESHVNQTKTILRWIVMDSEKVDAILIKRCKAQSEDIKFELPDAITEEEVDLDLIWEYMEKSAIRTLKLSIKYKKERNYYTCLTCNRHVTVNSIRCDACLNWFHFNCQSMSKAKADKIDNLNIKWFCNMCDALNKGE